MNLLIMVFDDCVLLKRTIIGNVQVVIVSAWR